MVDEDWTKAAWSNPRGDGESATTVMGIMNSKNSKQLHAALEQTRKEIEEEIGQPLTWHNPEGKNA